MLRLKIRTFSIRFPGDIFVDSLVTNHCILYLNQTCFPQLLNCFDSDKVIVRMAIVFLGNAYFCEHFHSGHREIHGWMWIRKVHGS